ncbi:hypothetical protein CCR84_00560 [Rhodocyclus purpureus]|nr:hypothetical protein [Rhodocyclus purpureus]
MESVEGEVLDVATNLQFEQHSASLVAVLKLLALGIPDAAAWLLVAQTQASANGACHALGKVLTIE